MTSTARPTIGSESNTVARSSTASQQAELLQFIAPDGGPSTVIVPDQYRRRVDSLGTERLRAMYRHMAVMRRLDAEAAALQRQGELALWVPSRGQEGAQVGAAEALRSQDWLFPSYREHVMAMMRGVPFEAILAHLRGVTHGAWDWRGTHVQQYTLVIGTQSLHGVGFAHGMALDGLVGTGDAQRDSAVLTCFGDGATSEGDVSEAMVFAASLHAPVVFLCQSNGWAISVPTAVQAARPLAERARGFGLRSVRVDGNDVLASYAAAADLLDAARAGEGPGFIEAVTYRMGAHTSSDDPTKYRTHGDEAEWAAKDPIERYGRWLRQQRDVPQAFFDEVAAEGDERAAAVRAAVVSMSDPEPSLMFDYVYSERHPLMDRERAEFERYQATLAPQPDAGGAR